MVMTDTSDKAGKKEFVIIFLTLASKNLHCELVTENIENFFFSLTLIYLQGD